MRSKSESASENTTGSPKQGGSQVYKTHDSEDDSSRQDPNRNVHNNTTTNKESISNNNNKETTISVTTKVLDEPSEVEAPPVWKSCGLV